MILYHVLTVIIVQLIRFILLVTMLGLHDSEGVYLNQCFKQAEYVYELNKCFFKFKQNKFWSLGTSNFNLSIVHSLALIEFLSIFYHKIARYIKSVQKACQQVWYVKQDRQVEQVEQVGQVELVEKSGRSSRTEISQIQSLAGRAFEHRVG